MSDTTTTDAPDDLRALLGNAFDASDKPAPVAEQPKAAPVDAPEPAEEPSGDRSERPRGPDGKFLPKSEAAPESAEKPVEAEAKPEAPKPEAKVTEPPANWAEADKATFKGLPAEAQEFLLRRHSAMEADYTRKTQEIAAFKREYEPIDRLFAPHADLMKQRGLTPATTIQAWYNVEKVLMSGGDNAAAMIANIAQSYRVPPAQLAAKLGLTQGAPAASAPLPPPDGQQAAQQPIIVPPELQARLDRQDQWIRQQEAAAQQRAFYEQQQAGAAVENEITQFASATDTAGALLHPHFEEVKDQMVVLANAMWASGRKPVLSEIYDQAVRANPSTYQKVLASERAAWEAQRAAAEKQKQDEARAKAEAARKASKSITGAPGAGQAPRRGELTLREQLLEAADEQDAAA